jgi:hypothetical protein
MICDGLPRKQRREEEFGSLRPVGVGYLSPKTETGNLQNSQISGL